VGGKVPIGAGPDVARRVFHPFLGLYDANLYSTQIERFLSLDEEASVVRSEAVSQSTCETARQFDILPGVTPVTDSLRDDALVSSLDGSSASGYRRE
jgi:hypothetical protein